MFKLEKEYKLKYRGHFSGLWILFNCKRKSLVYGIACMTAEIIIPSDVTQTDKKANTSRSLLKWDEAIKNTETNTHHKERCLSGCCGG